MTEDMLDRKIGFVGLGRMGGGMAANLSKSAKSLTLYDLSPEKRNEFSKSCHVAADIDALLGEIDILCKP